MPEEIPIWSDSDVQRIYEIRDGRPFPRFYVFSDHQEQSQLVMGFVEADRQAGSDGPAEAFLEACLSGIRAVEGLPIDIDAGWRKFLIYQIDENNRFLWNLYRRPEVAYIAEWTVETIGRYGWGPDGNRTPLGVRHSTAMALATMAGGGLREDPQTGQVKYGTGDVARRMAGVSKDPRVEASSVGPTIKANQIAECIVEALRADYPDSLTSQFDGLMWTVRSDSALALICNLADAEKDPPSIRVEVGVATGVHINGDTCMQLNEFNRELQVGRLFLQGQSAASGSGVVIHEEILLIALLLVAPREAVAVIRLIVSAMLYKANQLLPWLVEFGGGRALADDEWAALLT